MRVRDLTVRQTEVLCEIATGNSLPRASPRLLDALEARGLIVRLPDRVVGHDAFGPIGLPQYEMPTREHVAWCDWAASTFELPATDERGEGT